MYTGDLAGAVGDFSGPVERAGAEGGETDQSETPNSRHGDLAGYGGEARAPAATHGRRFG
jgi:hypothetical protein